MVSVEGHWKDTELLRHRRVQPSWVGRSRVPSIHWARLHLQHHQTRAQVRRDSPLQHCSHFLFISFLRALAFLLPSNLRIDLHALAHAPHL